MSNEVRDSAFVEFLSYLEEQLDSPDHDDGRLRKTIEVGDFLAEDPERAEMLIQVVLAAFSATKETLRPT